MQLYLAPMEEITGYVFRNVLERHFGGVDKYFTPFITPNQNNIMKTKDGREINSEHNKGKNVVIQVLTKEPEHFCEILPLLYDLGYREFNLNLGCPSKTVVKKYKGSGMLRDEVLLESFLKEMYEKSFKLYTDISISVKTRVGYDTEDNFAQILEIYNEFPISELIVHPRIQKDFYSGKPRMEAFDIAVKNAIMPLGYNGDIVDLESYNRLISDYGDRLSSVMIGRGAIRNPGIFREIKTGEKMSMQELRDFMDDLYETYSVEYGEMDGMFKLKEVWFYVKDNFIDIEKQMKAIRKAKNKMEYLAMVREIFQNAAMINA